MKINLLAVTFILCLVIISCGTAKYPYQLTNGNFNNTLGELYGKTTTTTTTTTTIPRGPAGGYVFYDKGSYSDGWRYLECAPTDQSTGIQWYNGSNTTTGAIATTIGTGKLNTATIVASQGDGSYAAKLCDDLDLGGYDDWFLPSKDELNLMYTNLKDLGVGGFTDEDYWSSSETNDYGAWDQYFLNGYQPSHGKYVNLSVRAVRAY